MQKKLVMPAVGRDTGVNEGKSGSIQLRMQAVNEKEYLYFKASWPTNPKEAGAY